MPQEVAMTMPWTRRHRHLGYVLTAAALAAGALITAGAAVVPQRARAAEAATGAGADAQAAPQAEAGSWCARIPPGFGHPPANLTPVALPVLQRSVEPVPATDGLIHLAYAAQATNTGALPADILGVVPVDPLAGFAPTGRNLITDELGRDVAGKVKLFATSPDDTVPIDGPEAEPVPGFSTRVPAGNSGLMFFDVTYTDPARIPRLLAHAITLASPDGGGGPGAPGLTDPVPVGCRKLAVLRPPLVGQGWTAFSGCCTVAGYHRDFVPPINGVLQAEEQFAIDYIQIGPNNACCSGPPQALTSWWGYGTPVLAAAPGVVVAVRDGLPDQHPVGTISPGLPLADYPGNHVIENIGGGQYAYYAHLRPGSIPSWVREGTRLRPGDLIGRLGNSGNSGAPHLHFQVTDSPLPLDGTGLPFVFDTQLLEGRLSGSEGNFNEGAALIIDRTGAGVRRNLMPARNDVFGYNLSSQ
jgi:Peptidase family M23